MTTLESTRLQPAQPSTPTSTPLSILDATVARFAPTGAIWVFDQPTELDQQTLLNDLQTSFTETLSKFPQWAGQLQWAPVTPNGGHTERFNRPIITYGKNTDPGVEWRVIKHAIKVTEMIPTAHERASSTTGSRPGAWAGDNFNQNLFISPDPLALANLHDYLNLPAMQVQLTLLHDAYAIGIKLAHCLADAQTLMLFMRHWSSTHQSHLGLTPSPVEDPIFDPALLDAHAAGDIDTEADQDIVRVARSLPLHRYSWWDIAEGYPPVCIPTTENSKPPAIDYVLSPSEPAPWMSWDFSRQVRYTQLHFTGAELRALQALALGDGVRDISRLDALLAHLWVLIAKARGCADSSRRIYLDLSLGVRARVEPVLPEAFVGSPLFLTHVGGPASWVCAQTLGGMAGRIRETMKRFTSGAVGAMLHDAAYEVSPQRLWQGFLGTEHVLVTSWLRLGLYDVGFGGRARYVHALMPKMDGCVQVMDGVVGDGGMDVAVYLDGEAMERLLS